MANSIRTQYELTSQNSPALGARVVYDIPRTGDLESLLITLTGSVTLSSAASALVTDGIANIIEAVELLAEGGKVVIASVPFRHLVNANFPRRKRGMVPSVTQPGLTIGTHTFEAEGLLEMGFGLFRPKDAFLRENAYSDLKLSLRFSTVWASVFVGGVASVQSFALSVRVKETLELPDAEGMASAPVVRLQRLTNDVAISGAANKVQFRLTPDQGLRGISLRVLNGYGALSDAVLSRCRVYVGKVLRYDLSANTMKESTKAEFAGSNLTGYYFIDFADSNGSGGDKLNDCLDLTVSATGGADSYIEFDTTTAGMITVEQHGYVAAI